MSKKSLIISVVIIFIIIAGAIGAYYFVLYTQNITNVPVVSIKSTDKKSDTKPPPPPPAPSAPTVAQQLEQIKKNYPEVITGIINFLDTKNSLKTTVKTNDGKVYILWPAQPESVYRSFGVKNGGRVEIQGKVLENGMLGWGTMKPI